mgnify:FL=1
MRRSIKKVIPASKVNMGGVFLDQPLPSGEIENVDPFLLIHHWKHRIVPGSHPRDVGVGPHPHRGFSPVTFVFKGVVEHQDSLGNKAVVTAGGTQWMFAVRGITHSERMPKTLLDKGGDLEFVQFWVNAPAKHKMEQPFYKPISFEETPVLEQPGSKTYVVSGTLNGITGPAPTYSPQLILRGELDINASVTLPIPANYNMLIYVLEGSLKVDNQLIMTKDMAIFNAGNEADITATADTKYIVLSGEPINEPVAKYGPFVMNNQTEVMQAVADAQIGKMGILIEEF